MNDTTDLGPEDVGKSIETRFIQAVNAVADPQFEDLVDLTNLKGESTGYCKVFKADKLVKGSMFSIEIPPVGRYFNIHLIPQSDYRIPRFIYEGMITPHGSQMTIDLFPDADIVMDFDSFESQYQGIDEIYQRALADDNFQWRPSRIHFMRAFFSPYVLLSFTVQAAQLGEMESYAKEYLEEWVKMYEQGNENNEEISRHISDRRARMQAAIKHRDPDLPAVIAIYGEEKTQAIQDATLL